MPDLAHLDLAPWHMLAAICGAVMALWNMALSAHNLIGRGEKGCVRALRRLALAVIAGALLWSVSYGLDRDWQPWPPFLLLCIGVDCALLASVVTAYLRKRELAGAGGGVHL